MQVLTCANALCLHQITSVRIMCVLPYRMQFSCQPVREELLLFEHLLQDVCACSIAYVQWITGT